MGLISFRFHPACAIDPLSAADTNYMQTFDLRQTDVLETKSDGEFLSTESLWGLRAMDHFAAFIAYLGQLIW